MVQGWPGLSQQAGCDQETGHTDRGAGDAGSEDNYLIISRRGEGRQETGGAGSLPATQPHSCWSCWPGKFARVDLAKLGQERQQYWETTSRQYRDTAGRREGGSSQSHHQLSCKLVKLNIKILCSDYTEVCRAWKYIPQILQCL